MKVSMAKLFIIILMCEVCIMIPRSDVLAQNQNQVLTLPGCNEVIATGSNNVLIEGKSAIRTGDFGRCMGFTLLGDQTVYINGRPAIRIGDQVRCVNGKIGVVSGNGANSVFIGGRPAATTGSIITGCN